MVATACLYRSARIARRGGRRCWATTRREFAALADRTRAAFNAEYVAADGTVRSDCTTAYTLAIVFDLLSPALEALAGDRLAELVAKSGHRISTGFAGTPYVCEALARTGHLDDAYGLLQQRECPSWLYPVTMGATTVWERWDSMLPDGSINPGEMTSFNHYALGAVADWMHRTVAGIAPLEPGYGKVLLRTPARRRPHLGGGVAGDPARAGGDPLVLRTTAALTGRDDAARPGVTGVLSLPDGRERGGRARGCVGLPGYDRGNLTISGEVSAQIVRDTRLPGNPARARQHGRPAAVDDQVGAGDVRRGVAREEERAAHHLLRLADPAQRDGAGDAAHRVVVGEQVAAAWRGSRPSRG